MQFIKLTVKQVLMRLIGADETIYSNFADTLQWLESTDVLEMIVDKFSSSVSTDASSLSIIVLYNIHVIGLLSW
jgi:hypothetical protein